MEPQAAGLQVSLPKTYNNLFSVKRFYGFWSGVVLALLITGAVVQSIVFLGQPMGGVGVVAGMVFLGPWILLAWRIKRQRVVASQSGIKAHKIFRNIHITWDQIERIEWTKSVWAPEARIIKVDGHEVSITSAFYARLTNFYWVEIVPSDPRNVQITQELNALVATYKPSAATFVGTGGHS